MEEKKEYGRPEADPVAVVIEPDFLVSGENIGGEKPNPGELDTP